MTLKRWLITLGCLLLTLVLWAGGGREAYRNYFLGSYYFNEGAYLRAENHLQRAYQADPDEFNFTLAYALVLGRLERTRQAETLLGQARGLLNARHPDIAHQRALLHFVTGMVYTYGRQYAKALRPLQQAAELQETLDYPEERSAVYNALGYARILNQGRGTGSHGSLGPHYHVHRRDLERGYEAFRRAYESNLQNTSARANYETLRDTLGITDYSLREDEPRRSMRYTSTKYANLPARMNDLLAFTEYDEVILLLDISGSMVMEDVTCVAAYRFEVMRQSAQLLLENMAHTTKVGIATIGGDCGTEPRLWIPVGSRSRHDLGYDLQFLTPDGTTPLLTILQETPTLFTDTVEHSKAIIFISDGENVCRVPGTDICAWSESLGRNNITINIMTFLGASLDNANAFAEYSCLAENTFGQILYLDGDRCRLEHYRFDLVKACDLDLPPIQRVDCWGPNVENLWAIFPEE
ncbi:MAG: VWA domain-containing protein [Lewinella sp.]|nr:VWA domain-containing protein [Lewinella sp.]